MTTKVKAFSLEDKDIAKLDVLKQKTGHSGSALVRILIRMADVADFPTIELSTRRTDKGKTTK